MPSKWLNWALWAIALVLIVALSQSFLEGLYVDRGTLEVREPDGEPDTVVLRWTGKIEAPMAARLAEAVGRWQGAKQRFVLELSSPGGSVGHGGEVIRILRQLKRAHVLETVVGPRDRCLSMCVPIFLQGHTRIASARSRFMFHEVSRRDALTDEAVPMSERDQRSRTDRLFDAYFRPAGVPDAWIADIRQAMRGRDVWRTGAELVEQRSGIVTRLR